MTRKPEPSFSLKQVIWDVAASAGTGNSSAVYREIDRKIWQLHKKDELVGEEIPDERTVRRIIDVDIQRLPPEVVVSKLPRYVWRLRHDYEEIKQLAEENQRQEFPIEAQTERKPYEETPHKQKMRELAKTLGGKIRVPSPWEKGLLEDLPVEFRPGKYQLPIGTVEISGDKIKVNYYDIGAGIAAPHLIKGLYSHLNSCGLSKFTELVGKLDNWIGQVAQYSESLMVFLKLIANEVKGFRAKVSFHDEVKPGLTKWFIIIAWNDNIQKASGYPWIDDSWYKPHESIPDTNLWQLRCGSYSIGIARSGRTLKTYEKWHKKLRVKYAENTLAKDIAARSQDLSNIAQDIRQRLQEFSDMERLPGNCELC